MDARSLALCESSEWGRGYRSGCRDMCAVIGTRAHEDEGLDRQAALAQALEECAAYCFEFCTKQVEGIDSARERDLAAPSAPPAAPVPGPNE